MGKGKDKERENRRRAIQVSTPVKQQLQNAPSLHPKPALPAPNTVIQFNAALDAILTQFTTDPKNLLKEEGLFRETGSLSKINNEIIPGLMKNPTETVQKHHLFPHEIATAIKNLFKSTPWSNGAKTILRENITDKTGVDEIELRLVEGGYTDEAKALHNMIYLGILVKENAIKGKGLDEEGVIRMLSPLILEVAGLGFGAVPGLKALIDKGSETYKSYDGTSRSPRL